MAVRSLDEQIHSFGPDCPHCGDGRPGTRCDLSGYSTRRVRFIKAHLEAYRSAYLNPNRAAASNEIARLEREYRTLPPRHTCTCWCPSEKRGGAPCLECRRLRAASTRQDVAVEIGRTSRVDPPMPSPVMLDLARAEDVLGPDAGAAALAAYMSTDGVVKPPDHPPTSITVELVCLMCSRPGERGQQHCRVCGGSLVLDPVADVG